MTSTDPAMTTPEEFADKIFTALLGTMETFSLYLGERLGWWSALAAEPAHRARAGAPDRDRRAVRPSNGWRCRRSTATCRWSRTARAIAAASGASGLPPEAAEVLTDEQSLSYLGALPRMFAAVGAHLEDLLGRLPVRRRGELGAARRRRPGVAGGHQPAVVRRELGPALAGVPELHEVLSAPGAGSPTSAAARVGPAIALARAYPEAPRSPASTSTQPSVDGGPGARGRGRGCRTGSSFADSRTAPGSTSPTAFDAAFVFEALHDMPRAGGGAGGGPGARCGRTACRDHGRGGRGRVHRARGRRRAARCTATAR